MLDSVRARAFSWARLVRGELWAGGRGWILVFIAGGWLVVLGTRFVFPALLPPIRAEFEITNTTAGLMITGIWVAYAVMQFPAGVLSDRIGERDILLAGVLVASLSLGFIIASPTFGVFLLGAVLFGVGSGLFGPPRIIALSNVFPARDSTAIAVTFAAGSIGSAGLPAAAGVITGWFGWRAGFLAAIPLFVVALVGIWRYVPRRTTTASRAAEGSARHTMRRLRAAVTDPVIVRAWIAVSISLFIFQGLTAFLPTYLVEMKGFSTAMAAVVFGLFFVGGATAQPIAGAAADAFGQARVLVAIAGFGVVPLVALPFTTGVVPLVIVAVLLSIQLGLGPINEAYIAAALPDDVKGSGYGLIRTVHMGLGATGAVVIGVLADFGWFDEAFFVLAGLNLVMILLYWRFEEIDRSREM